MSGDDESLQAARILSWAYLLAFMFLSSVARAFYSSQGIEPSAQFEIASAWGGGTLLWLVVRSEGRASRASFPVDAGLFIYMFSFLAVPMLLWRRQGWRSVGKAALLVAAWLASYELAVVLHHAIVWLQ